jgi:hypothetical protein
MSTEIVKTRQRLALEKRSVPALLKALGVDYHSSRNSELGFWKANEHILLHLYRELQAEVRERIRELRPDLGENAEEFQELWEAWEHAKAAFARHLPPRNDILDNVLVLPPGKGIAVRRQKKRDKERRYRERHKTEPRYLERGRCRAHAFRQRHKFDPEYQQKRYEQKDRWRRKNLAKVNASGRKWWHSPKGRAFVAKRRLRRQIERDKILEVAA